MPLITHVHRVAEIALEELHIRVKDEQAPHEFRARDELNERPTTGVADMEQQSTAHNQQLHHQNEQQTSWPRSELSRVTKTDQPSTSPLLDLADQRERADALQQQYH